MADIVVIHHESDRTYFELLEAQLNSVKDVSFVDAAKAPVGDNKTTYVDNCIEQSTCVVILTSADALNDAAIQHYELKAGEKHRRIYYLCARPVPFRIDVDRSHFFPVVTVSNRPKSLSELPADERESQVFEFTHIVAQYVLEPQDEAEPSALAEAYCSASSTHRVDVLRNLVGRYLALWEMHHFGEAKALADEFLAHALRRCAPLPADAQTLFTLLTGGLPKTPHVRGIAWYRADELIKGGADVEMRIAMTQMEAGDYATALDKLETVEQDYGERIEHCAFFKYLLALCYRKEKKLDKAISHLRNAITTMNRWLHLNRVNCPCITCKSQIKPDRCFLLIALHRALAVVYRSLDRRQETEAEFREGTELLDRLIQSERLTDDDRANLWMVASRFYYSKAYWLFELFFAGGHFADRDSDREAEIRDLFRNAYEMGGPFLAAQARFGIMQVLEGELPAAFETFGEILAGLGTDEESLNAEQRLMFVWCAIGCHQLKGTVSPVAESLSSGEIRKRFDLARSRRVAPSIVDCHELDTRILVNLLDDTEHAVTDPALRGLVADFRDWTGR